MPERIEDYGLIGDCETAALVSRRGSIDWLCWPRFDGGACFAALLGSPDHGRWLIAPVDEQARSTRRYRPDTLILETEFSTADGSVRLTDFMPLHDGMSSIIRLVTGLSGRLALRTELVLRFDYGSLVPWVSRLDDGTLRAISGPDMALLRTTVALRGERLKTVGDFSVAAGQTIAFELTYCESHRSPPAAIDPSKALEETEAYWRNWTSRCADLGEWNEAARRSLITLKALTYRPTGGIVAAPTTSLPERIGGERNWDYRYCWLRDATFTLYALLNAGFTTEARQWRDWLLRAVGGDPEKAQILYGLGGQRRVVEQELTWLPGYAGSRPVRIGNAAHEQFQLDTYGEMMDALHEARRHGLAPDDHAWSLQQHVVEFLEGAWDRPDRGIWEVRGPRRHFTHSKVLAWVAFDRAVEAVERWGRPGPVDRWRRLRAEIHEEVCREGFNVELNAFTQSYGSDELDASTLLIPLLGFLPADDPRVVGTVEAVQRDLTRDGFVERYRGRELNDVDGLPGNEGVFLPCSFWLVDGLLMLGRDDEARALFEKLLGVSNDLGLLAEEYDPGERRLLGNFPQAFTHVGLVNSAYNLSHHTGPGHQRGRRGE